MDHHFARLASLPPYVLAQVDSKIAELRAEGHDVFDFGLGNPDRGSPPLAVEKLIAEAPRAINHRYAPSHGIAAARRAICAWYSLHYGVDLDPDKEAVVTLGSKEGIGQFLLAVVNPGDTVLVPDPCYPLHRFGVLFAGGVPVSVAVGPDRDPVAELEAAYLRADKPPKLAIVNYPHNPTSATVTDDQMDAILAWADRRDLWIMSDLAYADIVFDGRERSPSLLARAGAKARVCEFFTISKSYNMPGWRVGFCVGNAELVGALKRMKSYVDYGHFAPIQLAAATVLEKGAGAVGEVRSLYHERRDALVTGLARCGWKVEAPRATMFVWAKLPPARESHGSVAFALELLEKARVAVAPGVGFGGGGEGYVRFALVEEIERINAACDALERAISL